MRTIAKVALTSVSLASLAAPALAAEAADDEGIGSDIIVTARRREESLLNVPQVVNAVTGDTLSKLNIQRLEDVKSVVPGLNLDPAPQGYAFRVTLRGVSFDSFGGADPSVEFYMNDAYLPAYMLLKGMYDVGQVEVLRGPQGTLRGRASPSGSITVTTRRPDLEEIGATIEGTVTNRHGYNGKAALNIPLIKDKVALRLAGLTDDNRGDFTESVNSMIKPSLKTRSGRISLRVSPVDWFDADANYQVLHDKSAFYQGAESIQITQPGAATAGFGPTLRAQDRLSILQSPERFDNTQKIFNGRFEVRAAGQKLNYVYQRATWLQESGGSMNQANFPIGDLRQDVTTDLKTRLHEVRLSSDERLFGMLDYTVGYFHSDILSLNHIDQFGGFVHIETYQKRLERAFFGNLTAHIGEKTELSAGLRRVKLTGLDSLDLTAPVVAVLQPLIKAGPFTKTIYNVSLSHHISDDLMVYVSSGSSLREGFTSISVLRANDPVTTPNLYKFLHIQPESSKSYEVGFKAEMLDKKLRVNGAYFHQDFNGFIYRSSPQPYVNISNGVEVPGTIAFSANVPAKVDGVELEVNYAPSRRFSIGGNFAWAKGKMKDGLVACTPPGYAAATTPAEQIAVIKAATGGDAVYACNVSQSINFAPPWSATFQSEYNMPTSGSTEGFLRGLLSVYANNKNDPVNPYDNVKNYQLLNVYLGVRDPDGAWEVSLFSKNITNTKRVLSRDTIPIISTATGTPFAPYGTYVPVSMTRPREFGLNARISLGSR